MTSFVFLNFLCFFEFLSFRYTQPVGSRRSGIDRRPVWGLNGAHWPRDSTFNFGWTWPFAWVGTFPGVTPHSSCFVQLLFASFRFASICLSFGARPRFWSGFGSPPRFLSRRFSSASREKRRTPLSSCTIASECLCLSEHKLRFTSSFGTTLGFAFGYRVTFQLLFYTLNISASGWEVCDDCWYISYN